MNNFKFTDSLLLSLALKELKTTKKKFQIKQYNKHNLQDAFLINQYIEDNSTEKVFLSKTSCIKTTKYLRIKELEFKNKLGKTNEKRK